MSTDRKMTKEETDRKMTKEEFVVEAIKTLRDPSRSQGIHSVYSGFNQAFKTYFGEEARPTTDQMAAAGKIVVQPRKGGVMIYLPGEAPQMLDTGAAALAKMGLKSLDGSA
jgi:hypothetical protein